MRKKELQQRLVTLTIQTQAMSNEIARLKLDVHTLKTQQAIVQGDWHVPSTYTK
jgi:hypothetical protein